FLLIYIYLEIKIRRSKLIQENESLLFKKEKEIVDRKVKIEGLQRKLNESFTEVVEMAKKNSPLFWPRFREVYPEFYEKMLIVNPKIRTSELTFCAYLYLGFTTKEIADYTFVTIRGVETRRNRLRKKYNIPSDMDFSVWIKSLGNRPIQ
ncbi:TPA: helix-turn-helix transcriptional regulator, partial [Elizabethkingia anophelis]